MSAAASTTTDRIRPLKDVVILHVDEGNESREAQQLLEEAGVECFVTDGPVESHEQKPLAIYVGGSYQGIKEIRGLLNLLRFWSQQTPLVQRGVFKGA